MPNTTALTPISYRTLRVGRVRSQNSCFARENQPWQTQTAHQACQEERQKTTSNSHKPARSVCLASLALLQYLHVMRACVCAKEFYNLGMNSIIN